MPNTETRANASRHGPVSRNALEAGQFVVTAEIVPPVSCDRRDLIAKVQAAQGSGRRRQRDGRRRRPLAHGLAGRGGAAPAGRHRADPATDLPRPQPHRAAERPARRGGAGHREPAAAEGRRSERRRPARRQAGVRHRLPRSSVEVARADSRPAHADVGPEGRRARPTSSSARPMHPSIRRPAGRPSASRRKSAAGAQFAQTQFCMDAERGQALRAVPGRQRHLPTSIC